MIVKTSDEETKSSFASSEEMKHTIKTNSNLKKKFVTPQKKKMAKSVTTSQTGKAFT